MCYGLEIFIECLPVLLMSFKVAQVALRLVKPSAKLHSPKVQKCCTKTDLIRIRNKTETLSLTHTGNFARAPPSSSWLLCRFSAR